MPDLRAEIAALFQELAELTTLDEANPQSFRVRAYENAVFEIKSIKGDISTLSETELVKHRGIGKSSAKKIREYIETGAIAKLEELREKYPPAFVELSRIGGLGPKKLKRLRQELGVEAVDDLRAAIESHRVRELSGFGEKTEENLARALERLGGRDKKEKRTPIGDALPLAERIVAELCAMPEVEKAEFCGSLRRMRETIGDIDIVVASKEPAPIMERFVAMPAVAEVLAHGDTKSSVVTRQGLQIDLRVVEPAQYGAALMYFTGSKAHNIRLRQRALERGLTLNEYALAEIDGGRVVASRTEKEIFAALDLEVVPPPMREDTGEVEAAAAGELPAVVEAKDIKGDLHVHTSLSGDARSSLEEVVASASELLYRYLAITEHGEDLAMNGVGRDALLEQRAELAALQKHYPRMRLLQGCELNIGKSGDLDYDEEFRHGFDLCVAAIHSHFDLDARDQTERLIRAIRDPSVRILGHLSGRIIGQRPGANFDVEAVLKAAAETRTAIEINSGLARLDASAEVARRGRDLGVLFAINTDAHRTDALTRMKWGALYAQRGWVERDRVVNTWPLKKFLTWVAERA